MFQDIFRSHTPVVVLSRQASMTPTIGKEMTYFVLDRISTLSDSRTNLQGFLVIQVLERPDATALVALGRCGNLYICSYSSRQFFSTSDLDGQCFEASVRFDS